MIHRAIAAGAFAAMMAGCAIHPLPDNVTPFDTNNIVFHIRCEARDAAKHATVAFLLNRKQNFPLATVEAGRKLRDGETKFENFDPKALDPRAGFYLTKYQGTAIAYDFKFDITEGNTVGANINFLSALTHGTFGLAAGVNTDRQRETIRTFRILDKFGDLQKLKDCDNTPGVVVVEDYVYPITGTVGLDEMVMTFVNLNEHENLAAPPSKGASLGSGAEAFASAAAAPPGKSKSTASASGDAKVPVMSDTFNFQTTISGSVTPTLTLVPVSPSHFNLTQGSIPLSASRKDVHTLIVALSLEGTSCDTHAGLLISSPLQGAKGAGQCALKELDNQKTLNTLGNIGVPR